MHYGDGMMKEEIERARKRAEAASPRKNGFRSYQSPLGAGFRFDRSRPMDQQTNPYSRRGRRQHDHLNEEEVRIEYEEAYFDVNGGDAAVRVRRGKEYVVERMKVRRKTRKRERGDPLRSRGSDAGAENDSACVIM